MDEAWLEALIDLAIDVRPEENLRRPVRVLRVDADGTSRDVSGPALFERFPELRRVPR